MLQLFLLKPIISSSCKKEGDIRLCLDAQFINKIIISDLEALEPIDEIVKCFSGVKYLT